MQKELIAYYHGKNLLAKMMGSDPETFTEKDVEVITNRYKTNNIIHLFIIGSHMLSFAIVTDS